MKKHGADIEERKKKLKEEEKENERKKTQEEALRRHRKIRQCGEAFTRRSFYTQNPLHTEPFTHRTLYTQTPLHTGTFTHRGFYTQALVDVSHTDAHTQKLLHTDALHTEAFTHRSFCTQTLLHTDAFTDGCRHCIFQINWHHSKPIILQSHGSCKAIWCHAWHYLGNAAGTTACVWMSVKSNFMFTKVQLLSWVMTTFAATTSSTKLRHGRS